MLPRSNHKPLEFVLVQWYANFLYLNFEHKRLILLEMQAQIVYMCI